MYTLPTWCRARSGGSHQASVVGRTCPVVLQQQMVLLWTGFVVRLFLCFLVTPVMGQASATATSSSTFFSALTDPEVTLILIPPDNCQLIPEDWARFNRSHPYVLDRDVLVRSSEPPELGQMDFQFLMRKVLIAENVTLTLESLVLRNVNKLGGFGLDFFMGDKGSVIDASNSVRVKLVCPPPEQSGQAARAFSAPEGFPANEVSIVDGVCVLQNRSNKQLTAERKCYDDAIKFSEFTLMVGSVDPDAGTAQPGYRLAMHNVTRVCDNYVSAECVQQQSEDMCTAQLLQKLLSPDSPGDSSWQPQTIAGVVVGGVCGFLAVCCLVGVLLWKHRRWWRNGNGNVVVKESDFDDGADGGKDPTVGGDSTRQLRQQLLTPGLGGKEPDPSKAVKLGVLLGSGSFGRVFKGRWHGMDVAVKIMDPCTPDTLPRVLKEAEVMMGLEHQNIVKAYQCSVWSKKQQEEMLKAAAQRRASEASSPRKGPQRKQAAGRRSSGSASLHSSSTASQAASSTSTAAGLQHAPAGPSTNENVVISIIPAFVPRHARPGMAAAAAGAGGPLSVHTGTSSSSIAAGTLSGSSTAHPTPERPSCEGAGSSASAARRMFTRFWKYQQQEVPEHMLSGPPTASRSGEFQLRTGVTPLSSAAYTLSGSSSMGTVPTGASAHTAAGVISSIPQATPALHPVHVARSQTGTVSSSSTGVGTSGALSSQGLTTSSAGQGSTGAAAAAGSGEIQPAAARPVMGWLRRSSKRTSQEVSDIVPGSDSGSSKAGSPAAAQAGSSQSGSQPDRDEMQVWLVLELCTGGSLKDAVTCGRIRTNSCQDMAKLLSRLLDAANGLAYLHTQGVIHGDLKAANVLLQHSVHGTYGQIAKVSDFGVSARLLDGATHRSTTSLGTITHMAPEVLRSGRLSKAADVYAFGVMMWEVFTNQTAFAGCHSDAVVERVVLRGERPPLPAGMPPQYTLLMQRCWDEDPAKRPTFEQVIACIELLLDNLTSSDSEGRISEGVEEERTSSSNSDVATADKAAVAEVAAAAAAAAFKPRELVPSATQAATGTPSASSSGRNFLRFLSRGSSAGVVDGHTAGTAGKGLAESVEGSSDWLSGPGTPGFNIPLEQLRGIRQWYMANAPVLQAADGAEADLEAQRDQPCEMQYTPGYRSSRLQPWLDQCVDALSPSSQQKQGADQPAWLYRSRRWLMFGAGKLRHAQGSTTGSLSQQPTTPRLSGIQRV